MKPLITLWKIEPLKDRGFLEILETPASPVHSYLKFSAVFGTTVLKSSIVIRPAGFPSNSKSKNTLGLLGEDAYESYIIFLKNNFCSIR